MWWSLSICVPQKMGQVCIIELLFLKDKKIFVCMTIMVFSNATLKTSVNPTQWIFKYCCLNEGHEFDLEVSSRVSPC